MIINALDRHIHSLIKREPHSFKNEITTRVAALAASILAPIEAAARVVALPLEIAFYVIITPISLIARTIIVLRNPKADFEFISVQKKILHYFVIEPIAMTVAAIANAVLSPFVALISPKAMVRMHVDSGLTSLAVQPSLKNKVVPQQNGLFVSDLVKKNLEEKFLSLHKDETKKELLKVGLNPPTSIILHGPSQSANKAAAEFVAEQLKRKLCKATVTTAKDFNDFINRSNKNSDIYYIDLDAVKSDSKERVKDLIKAFDKNDYLYILSSKKLNDKDRLRSGIHIEVTLPDLETRNIILHNGIWDDLTEEGFDFNAVATALDGLKIKKIESCIKAIKNKAFQQKSKITTSIAMDVVDFIKSNARISIPPENNSDEFVGMEELHTKFNYYLEVLKNPKEAKEFGVKFPAGILLYGPPGCGKTYAARHLCLYAKSQGVQLNFRQIKSSDVASKWRGVGIIKMREIFEEAKKVAPAVLFIDECEGLFPSRDRFRDTFGAERTQELDEMLQMIEEAKEHNIIVVAATNHLESVDSAIFRTGRFDYTFEVKSPDAATRLKMFEAKLRSKKCEPNLDLAVLVKATEDFTASDIETIVNDAGISSWTKRIPISLDLLMTSLDTIRNKKESVAQGPQHQPEKTPLMRDLKTGIDAFKELMGTLDRVNPSSATNE